MPCEPVKAMRQPRGYFTLYVDGEFAGNYDSYKEAMDEYDEMVKEEKR